MRRNSSQYSGVSSQRLTLLLSLLIICLATGAFAFTQLAGAQTSQKAAAQVMTAATSDSGSSSSGIVYPPTKKVDHVDTYFGTAVPDPYRWLGDENSPETASWVEAENKVTFAYLDKLAYRPLLKTRLEKLYNYPRISAPSRRGEWFFFSKNDGLQNQSVQYIQKGLDGAPEVLIDPNKFSKDGTAQLSAFSISKHGKYLAYGISQGGSDWSNVYVMEISSRQTLSDKIEWLKASGVS